MLVYHQGGEVSALSCQDELGPVLELVAGPPGSEEGAAPTLICLLASGRACKVVLTGTTLVADPHPS